jgi:hypothetical protein
VRTDAFDGCDCCLGKLCDVPDECLGEDHVREAWVELRQWRLYEEKHFQDDLRADNRNQARTVPREKVFDVEVGDEELLVGAGKYDHADVGVVGLQRLHEVREVRLDVEVEKINGREGIVDHDVQDARGVAGLERSEGRIPCRSRNKRKKRNAGEVE